MNQTNVGEGVILKELLLTKYIFFIKKKEFKNSAKCAQQSMIFT